MLLRFGAGRRHAIAIDPSVEIGAVIFHAPSELQKGRPYAAVPPLRPFCLRRNQIKFIIRIVIKAICFKNLQWHLSNSACFRLLPDICIRFGRLVLGS